MTGRKFKLAHKRAGAEKWSASERVQRRNLIKILLDMADELSKEFEKEEIENLPSRFRIPHDGHRRPMVAM